eukprot:scaffold763_cov402-Prasinococcus_capsulatus_cf.AAC.8
MYAVEAGWGVEVRHRNEGRFSIWNLVGSMRATEHHIRPRTGRQALRGCCDAHHALLEGVRIENFNNRVIPCGEREARIVRDHRKVLVGLQRQQLRRHSPLYPSHTPSGRGEGWGQVQAHGAREARARAPGHA